MSRWYIIHAYSGFENKVRDAILSEANRLGLTAHVEQIEVPTETITEIKRGKKVQSERKFMPGYVLAKLTMTDDVYHLVKHAEVTGFLGPAASRSDPRRAASRMLASRDEAAAIAPQRDSGLRNGDSVKASRSVRKLHWLSGTRFRPQPGKSSFRFSAALPLSSSSRTVTQQVNPGKVEASLTRDPVKSRIAVDNQHHRNRVSKTFALTRGLSGRRSCGDTPLSVDRGGESERAIRASRRTSPKLSA